MVSALSYLYYTNKRKFKHRNFTVLAQRVGHHNQENINARRIVACNTTQGKIK